MEKLLQSANTRPGADYGLDHEFCFANFRLILEKVGKTTRPFRYNLNPLWFYSGVDEYFKGLDLVHSMPEELWIGVHTGDSDQNHLQEKEMQEGKVVI